MAEKFKIIRELIQEKETKNKIKFAQVADQPQDLENLYLPKFLFPQKAYPKKISVIVEEVE